MKSNYNLAWTPVQGEFPETPQSRGSFLRLANQCSRRLQVGILNTDLEYERRRYKTVFAALNTEAGAINHNKARRMLSIDYWMPTYDFAERHETRVRATPERVYQAIRAADFGRHSIFKLLFGLRALPKLLLNPSKAREMASRLEPEPKLTLDRLFQSGFVMLEERQGQEMVLGLTGKFWRPGGGIVHTEPIEFQSPTPKGMAKGAWNFALRRATDDSTLLTTETRVWCPDAGGRRRFGAYWMLVRPFSGLLRRIMLKEIRKMAEQ